MTFLRKDADCFGNLGTYSQGFVRGAVEGDGTREHTFGPLDETIFEGRHETVQGFLLGLFTVCGVITAVENTPGLKLPHTSQKFLREVQTVLSLFGIVSNVFTLAKRTLGHSTLYELGLNHSAVVKFEELVGDFGELSDVLDHYGRHVKHPETYTTTIRSIRGLDSGYATEDAGCIGGVYVR